jgi:hypothetical protein
MITKLIGLLPTTLTGIAGLLTALIAGITFFWNIVQFLWTRARESRERQFATYHSLVKQLVEGDSPNVSIDRQAAVVFELRHFPRYYGYTERMLNGLKQTWRETAKPRLIDEIDLTLAFIRRKWRYRLSEFMGWT